MSKPIVIMKITPKKWHVFVNGAPVVRHMGKLNFDRSVAGIGSDSLPILQPHNFSSKGNAEGIAHQIGRYVLQLGDMLFSYVPVCWFGHYCQSLLETWTPVLSRRTEKRISSSCWTRVRY